MSDIQEEKFGVELLGLFKKDDLDNAINLIADHQVHKAWCDTAVAVYAYNKDRKKALDLIEDARKDYDVITWHNCILEYAAATLKRYLKESGKESIVFGQANLADQEILENIIDVLSPIVEHVKADRRVSNPLELKAMILMMNAAIILGRSESLKELAILLREYKPIPLEYVGLALSRLVPASPDIATRIYDEHKGSLEANLLAYAVEAELYNNAEPAFEKSKELKALTKSGTDKMDLCGTLFQISQLVGVKAMQETYEISTELLGKKVTFTNVIAAAIQLRQEDVPKAKEILEKSKDENNPQWLQLYAFCLFAEDDFEKGIEYYLKAIEQLPSIEMYKILGEAAYIGGFVDKAINAFEMILKANPDDENVRAKVAHLYLKTNNDSKTEEHLGILWERNKNNFSYGMNYAACQVRQGNTDEALEIYQSLCGNDDPPVEAILAIAHLHKVRHQPLNGFNFLDSHKDKFWESPSFLMAYVDLGYASCNESKAHNAFMQVRKLQAEGKAPQEIIQVKTIDNLLEYHEEWNKKIDLICQNLLQGKFPWLMADSLLNHAIFIGWTIRTQPILWINDDLISRASYSIYATNSFHPQEVDGRNRLKPLALPEKGSNVVIDLSSLITLHRLNLLEETSNFFSKIYISNKYIGHLQEESGRLEFHQLSRVESARQIKQDLDAGRISVLPTTDSKDGKYAYIHEYSLKDDHNHYYRLRDLHKVLCELGKMSKSDDAKFIRVFSRPSGVDADHPELHLGQNIIIDLSTLKTLINIDAYESVRESFSLYITTEDNQVLVADINTIDWQKKTQRWNDDLKDKLAKNIFESLPVPDTKLEVWLDAVSLAKCKGMNLMADDRVLQVLGLNDANFKGDVFSVDCLLKAFEQEEFLKEQRVFDAFLQLMKWRYRFLVPSVKMIIHLAKQYESKPPGVKLIEISRYVHDCMRDPGLFYGPEQTDPPVPMAGWLFKTWIDVTFDFITELWKDESLEEDVICKFTEWALSELLPSPPKNLIPGGIKIIDSIIQISLETSLMNIALYVTNETRARKAVAAIRKALYLTDEVYYKIFTHLIDLTGNNNPEDNTNIDGIDILRHRLSTSCLGDTTTPRTYLFLYKYNIVDGAKESEDRKFVEDAFKETESHCDISGPFIFTTKSKDGKRTAIRVAHLLLRLDSVIRKAALDYMLAESCITHLCPETHSKIKDRAEDILSESKDKWTSAAIEACDAIQNDWLFNYQGVLQSIKTNYNGGLQECITAVMRPDIVTLSTLRKGILSPSNSRKEIIEEIKKIVSESPDFNKALERYYQNFGHVPLEGGMSISSLHDEWVKEKGNVGNLWQLAWEWAELHESPLPRYHICSLFLKNSDLIPDDDKKKILGEFLAIINSPDDNKHQEAWLIRCELARYYTQYLECRLPGASSEMIASQSWWLADRMALVYGSDSKHIKGFREETVKPEEEMMNRIWRIVHLSTEPSTLRYGTLFAKNVWIQALCSQLNEPTLHKLWSEAKEEQKEQINKAISGCLLNLFPMKVTEEVIFAFDKRCVTVARDFMNLAFKDDEKEILSAFISAVEKICSDTGFQEALTHLPEANLGDQLFICIATKMVGHLDKSSKEYIWDCIVDRDWLKGVVNNLDLKLLEQFFDGLNEIQLRNKGKWDEQLPHVYASLCDEFREDEDAEKLKYLFAFTILSSLIADSTSAIDRLLKSKDKFSYKDEVEIWRQNIEYCFPFIPEWCCARLRAILASLHI